MDIKRTFFDEYSNFSKSIFELVLSFISYPDETSNVVIKSKPILVFLFFSYIYVIYKIAHIYFFIYNFYECVD